MTEAKRIEATANNALNASQEAKRLADEMAAMPEKTEMKIQRLRAEYVMY